jgi:WD40 repeat protein
LHITNCHRERPDWRKRSAKLVLLLSALVILGWEWFPRPPATELQGRLVGSLDGHKDIQEAVISADGETVAGFQDVVGGGFLWRKSGSPAFLRMNTFAYGGMAIAFSPDGSRLIVRDIGDVQVYDLRPKAPRLLWGTSGESVFSAAWDRDGARVVLGTANSLQIRDGCTGRELNDLAGRIRADEPLGAFSPDGHRVVAAGRGQVTIANSRTGAILKQFKIAEGGLETVSYSSDGELIVCQERCDKGFDYEIGVYEASTGRLVHRLTCTYPIFACEWAPTGPVLLVGAGWVRGYSGAPLLGLIDVRSGRYLTRLRARQGVDWVTARWLIDNKIIRAIDRSGEIWEWTMPGGGGA